MILNAKYTGSSNYAVNFFRVMTATPRLKTFKKLLTLI